MAHENDFDSGDENCTPLRLTGGGETESEGEVSSTFSQHTLINEGVDASQVFNENDLVSIVDYDNIMSEQDIQDVLLRQGTLMMKLLILWQTRQRQG